MNTVLAFIIPVRHPDNADDWSVLKSNLAQTLKSIAAQTNPAWRAVVVANHGADLPALPDKVEVVRVDFPPNQMFKQGANDLEDFRNAVRMDKGRRLLAGMLHVAASSEYLMVVDDDDFISRELVDFVAANRGSNGWYFKDGYVWGDRQRLLYRHPDFSMFCGTSHIIRTDLFALPAAMEQAEAEYIRTMLGSHVFIKDHLDRLGAPLQPLPFMGAVYRIGHIGAHSRSRSLLRSFFMNKEMLRRPFELMRRLRRLRLLNSAIRSEFWGA